MNFQLLRLLYIVPLWLFLAPIVSCLTKPAKIRFTGTFGSRREVALKYCTLSATYWCFAWQGLYGNFRVQYKSPISGRLTELHVGHRIWPQDIFSVPQATGFVLQWRTLTD